MLFFTKNRAYVLEMRCPFVKYLCQLPRLPVGVCDFISRDLRFESPLGPKSIVFDFYRNV